MVLEKEKTGLWGRVNKKNAQTRVENFEQEFHELAERNSAVEEVFCALRNAMNGAEISVRAADEDNPGRFVYTFVADHPVRVAAARTLAQMLGLIKTSAGVTVNNGPQQTLNVTAVERLAELDSIGVPREDIAAACADLLAATGKGAAEAPTPAADSQATGGF